MNYRRLTSDVRVALVALFACGCAAITATALAQTAEHTLPPNVTAAWLRGTWGPNANGGKIHQSCDTENVVTFQANGRYQDGSGHGLYRTDGKTITYYNRVLVDEADYSEDRTQFRVPTTTHVRAINAYTLSENGSRLYRCRER